MGEGAGDLSAEERAIVEEEEALLARARAALEAAAEAARTKARRAGDLRSVEALRALREEAVAGRREDLPALLSEMRVRQRLLEMPEGAPLPNPASPYVAHLRVREGGGRKDYLLGGASFIEPQAGVRIVDWRVAPIARIFYQYREGDDYEESLPGRTAEGVVEARRVVVISRGALQRILGDGVALARGEDGRFRREDAEGYALSGGGAGSAARAGALGVGVGAAGRADAPEVTALLDAEQFAAVSTPAERPLLVLGSAGSGKTTVALHRLARITAGAPEQWPLSRARVVVPEEGLARLSRRLLMPLGVGEAQVQTLDEWARALAAEVFEERLPALCEDPPALVSSLKRHASFYRAVRRRFEALSPAQTSLRRLRRRLGEALTDRGFLEEVIAGSAGGLPRTAIEETVRHTMLQLAEPVARQLSSITMASRKHAVDGRAIEEGTPDALAGTLDIVDLPVLLFLRAWRSGLEAREIGHLTLDEAEDLSLFELFVLGRLLGEGRSVTLAGDEAQQTLSSFAGWDAALEALGVVTPLTASVTPRLAPAVCRLSISYRCPAPVAAFAHAINGEAAPAAAPRAARQGAPVGLHHFPGEDQALVFLRGAIEDLVVREPRASVAVIARDEEAARRVHAALTGAAKTRLTLRGELTFEPGVDVTDVLSVKGLEFDYVIVPDASAEAYPDTAEARRRLHVAVTRTSHQLWVLSSGARSPILAGIGAIRTAPEPRAASVPWRHRPGSATAGGGTRR